MLIHGKRIDAPVSGQKIFNAVFIYDINTAPTYFMAWPSANKLIDTMHIRVLLLARISLCSRPQSGLPGGVAVRVVGGCGGCMHLMGACQCQTTKAHRTADWGGWKPKEKCWKMYTASMAEQKRADKFICNPHKHKESSHTDALTHPQPPTHSHLHGQA